ncbi:MAG: hypothetical protein E6R08_03565 [Nevskiaceae bacterium]|nr:MAG: hypothetical protein E6R08_03565 [Nevskiaceae bacterium]
MKADISLAERRRIEREQQAEIRAMLAPRHFATMRDQMAIDATLARLELEHLIQAAPAIYAAMGRTAVPLPAPVVMPEPEPVAPPVPEPVAVRPGAPDLPYDLRYHLGLR